ncbi:MAG: CaiB/BaiF CoA transferase family protein [Janthinobacterium lividum]
MSQTERSAPPALRDALQGVRVVDFTTVMSGPYCTRMMADLGADVIKVESAAGDFIRFRPPIQGGKSTYFGALNCGKRSVVIDMKDAEGYKVARDLALSADVVVENFRPGVMKRLGLDFPTLSALNERLIYCSLSGFGQTGPDSHKPAYAPVIHAASGYEHAFMTQQTGQSRPANNGIFMADVLGATHAMAAIQVALFDRERSGKGQYIDLALLDGILGMMIYEMQLAQFPQPKPRHLYTPVKATDGFVMVAPVSPKNLLALFEVIERPELARDERFSGVRAKEENWQELMSMVEAWTSQRSAKDCERILMAAGVPCSPYKSVSEAMADPQLRQRGGLSEVGEGDGKFLVANLPFRMSNSRTEARSHVPELGQHTSEVLKEVLGLSEETLQSLRERASIGGF